MFFLLSFFSSFCHAQDERYLRKLFIDKWIKKHSDKVVKSYKYHQTTSHYQLDLDGDEMSESLLMDMKGGEIWINIYNATGKKIKEFELQVEGQGARVYQINKRKLSLNSDLLIVHFYEGYNTYLRFRGTSRLYFITWDDNNLKTLSLYKGPVIFDEFESLRGHYHRRTYKLSLLDFNDDGIKEVLLKHHLISKVYRYRPGGRWKSL